MLSARHLTRFQAEIDLFVGNLVGGQEQHHCTADWGHGVRIQLGPAHDGEKKELRRETARTKTRAAMITYTPLVIFTWE